MTWEAIPPIVIMGGFVILSGELVNLMNRAYMKASTGEWRVSHHIPIDG